MIVGGFIGAGLSGVYIDKTRNYITLAKPMVLFLTFSSAAVVIVCTLCIFCSCFHRAPFPARIVLNYVLIKWCAYNFG